MKNDPEDIRQTAAGDPHYAGTEPDGGCRGGRGIPELCQLEQDKFVPSITVVLRLAKALRVPVERLLPTEPELKKRRCAS